MTSGGSTGKSVSFIQAIAIVMLLLTVRQTISHFNESLGVWGYSDIEIGAAYLFPVLMGLAISMTLRPKYWRGFEFAFVAVYGAGIVARLAGLTEPAISIFVVTTCVSIMIVVQIGVLNQRESKAQATRE